MIKSSRYFYPLYTEISMKRVLIIEDENLSALRLKKMINDIDDTVEVDGPLTNVAEVVAHLKQQNDYDLIFADIRLTDGDIFMAFKEVMPNCFVIFTTAYDEYAMDAIKNHGIDYLLKPIDESELREAMEKVSLGHADTCPVQNIVNEITRYKERIVVYKGEDMLSLRIPDILYFVIDGRGLNCVTENGEKYCLTVSMQEIEQQLDPNMFFRLNRQYLVNISSLRKISPYFNSKLIVKLHKCDDEEIIVSRERSLLFKKWLDQ